MSITLSDTDKIYKKSFHHRNDSGELDVFEAARYFSGYNEAAGYHCATYSQKIFREDRQSWRGGRISLDVPMRDPLPQHANVVSYQPKQSHHHAMEKQMKEKKYKQPSSPGGRLASFLNSLFNQSSSKKKKSKSATQSMKDEEESPGGRRRRRSSISHFRSSSTTDSKSLYSSSSSGFRTPPPYANTPTKSYKDLRSYSDHKQVLTLSKHNGLQPKSTALQNEGLDDRRNINTDLPWLDEKFKFNNAYSEKQKNPGNGLFTEKDRIWVDQYSSEEKAFKKFNENNIDDGAESDSSSDLFELQNYDLGIYSSGLPVYETTHMDSIKRGAPISNGAL